MKRVNRTLTMFFIFDAILFFFQSIAKEIYTPLLIPLQAELMISSTQAGLLITLVMFGYALARFPSGIMTDTIGCKRTIIGSSFLIGITLLAVALAPSYLLLAILTFIMGLTTGLYVTAAYTFSMIVSFENKETTFTALLEIFGGIGALISPLLVVLFVESWHLTWRAIFFSLGVGVILTNSLFMYFARAKDVEGKDNVKLNYKLFIGKIKESLKLFKNFELAKFIIWATLVGGFGFFAITGFRAFIPSLLVEKGYSFVRANQLFAIISVVGLITKIGVAWLADKFGTKRILFIILIINFIFFLLLTSQIDHLLVICSLIILGVTFSSHNTLINSYVLKLFPEEYRGRGFGLFATLYTVIYSQGPIVTGFFTDKFNLIIGMRVSIIGILIAGILLMLFNFIVDTDLLAFEEE